ncbi:MAG TPA: YetF domain-containing protein [Gemmatimonadaceae bacterium]|nr:YetF domain-containing protein [Gemmatimonadaceae bacterium]
MFFSSWTSLWHIVLLATVVYVALVAALRMIGSRALAKMSAYDLVVTIALGSLIATIPLQRDVTVADGLTAIATFLVLQHAMSWLLERSRRSRPLVKGKPTLCVYEGRMLEEQMRELLVTDEEVRAAIRSHGLVSVRQCLAVVLENDGEWSVIPYADTPDRSALAGLKPPVETLRAGGDVTPPPAR